MVIKLGYSTKQIRNTWKVLKCGAGEGWRRSAAPIREKCRGIIQGQGGEEYPTSNKKM
jgi:hypothetical protein